MINITENEVTPLFRACYDNSFETVESLLQGGVNSNELSAGVTPLYIAVDAGYFKIAKLLLAHEANPHFKLQNKQAMLWTAAAKGFTDTVNLLLEHGADIDEMSHDSTALYVACQNCHAETVSLLLTRGADFDINCMKLDRKAIHAAVFSNSFETLTHIVNSGADIDAKDVYGMTALHLACVSGNVEIVNMLTAKGAYLNPVSLTGQSPYSISSGQHVRHALIKNGATVMERGQRNIIKSLLNYRRLTGLIPLFGNKDPIDKVLETDVSLGYCLAIQSMTKDQRHYFTKKLLDISLFDVCRDDLKDRDFKLTYEYVIGTLMLLQKPRMLVNEGNFNDVLLNNINLISNRPVISLLNFGFSFSVSQIKNLVDNILKFTDSIILSILSDGSGHAKLIQKHNGLYRVYSLEFITGFVEASSLDVALKIVLRPFDMLNSVCALPISLRCYGDQHNNSRKELNEIKQEYLSKFSIEFEINNLERFSEGSLYAATVSGDESTVKYLFRMFPSMNPTCKSPISHIAYNPLMLACHFGLLGIVKVLLNAGANVNIVEKNSGDYALFLAVCYGNGDLVHCLLQHGAKIDLHDSIDKSPIACSVARGYLDIIMMLECKGINLLTALDETFFSTLEWARRAKHEVVAGYIEHKERFMSVKKSLFGFFDAREHVNTAVSCVSKKYNH